MNTNAILRNTIVTGIFATLFIPFIVSGSLFFPFITGKNFAFRILVEILFGVWAILALRDASYRPSFSLPLLAVGVLTLFVGIADIFSENPIKSFWSNYERMEGFVTLLHLLVYFLITISVFVKENLWIRFFQTSLGAAFLMSIYGVFQLMGAVKINQGGVRLDGTFGNATYLAIYMVFNIFIAAFLYVRRTEKSWLSYIYLGLMVLYTFILYHTATRGALLGFIGGVLVTAFLIALFERGRSDLRKVAIGIMATVLILVGGFFTIKDTSFVKESEVLSRFSSISLEETTTKSRFIVWDMAFQGFKERPFLGWGQESFNFVFNKYYDPRMYAQEQWFDRTHNVVLDWLIAAGLPGLVFYLSIFVAAFVAIWQRRAGFELSEKAVLSGMLVAYFIHNLFVFDNIGSYLLFFSILAYLSMRTARPFFGRELVINTGVVNRIFTPLVVVLVFTSLYFFNAKGLLANVELLQALSPQAGGYAQNIEKFKKALSYNSFGNQEIREQLIQASSNIKNASVDLSLKQSLFDLAKTEIEKQAVDVPTDARAHLFLGGLLNNYGLHKEAMPPLERALELSPNKQGILFEIGSVLLNLKDYDGALNRFKVAYDLEPTFLQAASLYATAAVYKGDNAFADSLLEKNFGTKVVADDPLIQAYVTTKQFSKVVVIWEKKVAENPSNPQFHLSLAASYFQMGRKVDAVREIRKVIELNPGFKTQGENYIREIEAGRMP